MLSMSCVYWWTTLLHRNYLLVHSHLPMAETRGQLHVNTLKEGKILQIFVQVILQKRLRLYYVRVFEQHCHRSPEMEVAEQVPV